MEFKFIQKYLNQIWDSMLIQLKLIAENKFNKKKIFYYKAGRDRLY